MGNGIQLKLVYTEGIHWASPYGSIFAKPFFYHIFFIKYILDRRILKLLKACTFDQGQFLCDFKHLLHQQYSSEDASSYFKEGCSTIYGAVFVKSPSCKSLFNREVG